MFVALYMIDTVLHITLFGLLPCMCKLYSSLIRARCKFAAENNLIDDEQNAFHKTNHARTIYPHWFLSFQIALMILLGF